MVKVRAVLDGELVVLLGLCRNNTRELHEGKPILVDLDEVHAVGARRVLLFAGEDNDDLVRQVQQNSTVPPSTTVH